MSEHEKAQKVAMRTDELARLRAENERLTGRAELLAIEVEKQQIELNALRRPFEQSADVESIRATIAELKQYWAANPGDVPYNLTRYFEHGDLLLTALDATARQLRERVEIEATCPPPVSDSERAELCSQITRLEKKVAEDDDNRDVGEALMNSLKCSYPEYHWLQSPSEVVCDLLNDIYDLKQLHAAEIARLSSPPQERKDLAERQSERKLDKYLRSYPTTMMWLETLADIDALLGDCAAWRNAHALVTAERDEARGKAKQLEIELGHYHENTGLVPVHQRDTALSRIERLEGALRKIRRWEMPETGRTWDDGSPMSYSALWGSTGERDVILGIAAEALAASAVPALTASQQHTAGSGDGVAGD